MTEKKYRKNRKSYQRIQINLKQEIQAEIERVTQYSKLTLMKMMYKLKGIIDIGVLIVEKLFNLGFEEQQAIFNKLRIAKISQIL